MQPCYKTLYQLFDLVDEPNKSNLTRLYLDNKAFFSLIQGSTNNHQNWKGDYIDHVTEVLNIAFVLGSALDDARSLTFALSDAILILALHDIEKPWKYQLGENNQLDVIPELVSKEAQHSFRDAKLLEYGIILNDEQKNAFRYVEGELGEYSSRNRVMNPLAAFCHMCDVASARIWFDCPKADNDPWRGAKRSVEI
jgi:hypothetical protein